MRWVLLLGIRVNSLLCLVLYIVMYAEGCVFLSRRYTLKSPGIGPKRQRYHIFVDAQFVIQYGFTLPYRTCGIAQTRHPGELALSSTEVLSLLLLAIACHRKSPNQPSYTVTRLSLIQPEFIHCLLGVGACFCSRFL